MSIRSFLRMALSGGVCVACLAHSYAFGAESVEATPSPAPTTETTAPKPTDRKAALAQIQNDVLTFRSEFKARMARAAEDRHAVYENLHEKLTELTSMYDESSGKKEELAKEFQTLLSEIEKYGEQISALEQSLTTTETAMTERLDAVEKGAKSGQLTKRPAIADVPAAEGTPAEGEQEDSLNLGAGELFRLAHRYFMEKEYDVAIGGFHKFLTDFPDHQLAGSAQFWIAESFLQIDEYDIALQEYAKLIKQYPRNEKLADAYYGTGIALLKQGNADEAKKTFQYVIDQFGDSLAANKAQTRLKDIP